MRKCRLFPALLVVLPTLLSPPPVSPAAGKPENKYEPIKVGVVYYKDFSEARDDWKDRLAKLAEAPGNREGHRFQLAVGTYDDVLDWYKKGLVDAALMSPGMVALLLNSTDMQEELRNSYIGTVGNIPKLNTYASARRKEGAGDAPYYYRAVCLISAKNAQAHHLTNIDDLYNYSQQRQKEGKPGPKFIFVHPLSISGHILPELFLRRRQFKLDSSNTEWTYNHDESLRRLLDDSEDDPGGGDDPQVKVAFITDEVEYDDKEHDPAKCAASRRCGKDFSKLDFPELEQYTIPQDVLLLKPNVAKAERDDGEEPVDPDRIRDHFVDDRRAAGLTLQVVPRWLDQYKVVAKWLKSVDPEEQYATPFFTLDQIVARIINYDIQNGDTPDPCGPNGKQKARLALVLSGGGAKCAYQLGAVEALEAELDKHRVRPVGESVDPEGKRRVDISLVVGTSGGAINALCVALGLTKDEEHRLKLRDTWASFRQEDFLRPWGSVTLPIGLFLGLLQVLMLMRLALLAEHLVARWSTRFPLWTWLGGILVALAIVEIVLNLCDVQLSSVKEGVQLLAGFLLTPGAALWLSDKIFFSSFAGTQVAAVDHFIFHLWAVVVPTLLYSSLVLLFFGGWMLSSHNHPIQSLLSNVQAKLRGSKWAYNTYAHFLDIILSWRALASSLVSICLVCLLVMILLPLFYVESISDASGVEGVLAVQIPKLAGLKDDPARGGDNERRLEEISEQIINGRKITRDLVITGSRLPASIEEIEDERNRSSQSSEPDDMYFYYDYADDDDLALNLEDEGTEAQGRPGATGGGPEIARRRQHHSQPAEREEAGGESPNEEREQAAVPAHGCLPLDKRFVSFTFQGNYKRLLDVVIGSSSIYPLFEPRPLKGIRLSPGDKDHEVRIIDGGFAHNSPIEAAKLWGATHIILIEASPADQPSEQQHLYSNAMSAFDYLYTQAQIMDARSHGQVEIFTLRPLVARAGDDPNSDLLDFSRDLILSAISKGNNDALNVAEPRFRREPGPPQFDEISSAPTPAAPRGGSRPK